MDNENYVAFVNGGATVKLFGEIKFLNRKGEECGKYDLSKLPIQPIVMDVSEVINGLTWTGQCAYRLQLTVDLPDPDKVDLELP